MGKRNFDKGSDGFRYKCVVSNSAGTVESSIATLTVQDADNLAEKQ